MKYKAHAKLERAFTRVYREAAMVEQRSACLYCREPITARSVTADHFVARANHGGNGQDNIKAACQPCNSLKGMMAPEQFKKAISHFPAGKSTPWLMAWVRRRLNLAIERFDKNLGRAMGKK